jgi:hypothetical protein
MSGWLLCLPVLRVDFCSIFFFCSVSISLLPALPRFSRFIVTDGGDGLLAVAIETN